MGQRDRHVSTLQDLENRTATPQPRQSDPPMIDKGTGEQRDPVDGLTSIHVSEDVPKNQPPSISGQQASTESVATSVFGQGEQIVAATPGLVGQAQVVESEVATEADEPVDDQAQIVLSEKGASTVQTLPSNQPISVQPTELSATSLATLQSQIDPGRTSNQSNSVVVQQGEATTPFTQNPDDSGQQVASPALGTTNREGHSLGGENQKDSGSSQVLQANAANSSQQVQPGQVDFTSHLEVVSRLSASQPARSDQQVAVANDVAPAPSSPSESNDANISRVMRGMRGVINQNGGAVTLRSESS